MRVPELQRTELLLREARFRRESDHIRADNSHTSQRRIE
jgi:hypothetical protein